MKMSRNVRSLTTMCCFVRRKTTVAVLASLALVEVASFASLALQQRTASQDPEATKEEPLDRALRDRQSLSQLSNLRLQSVWL